MRLRAVGLLSQTATTFEPSNWSRFLTTFGPQYPYPTTPNLTTASPFPLCINSFEARSASWLAGCSTVDIYIAPSVRPVAEHHCDWGTHQDLQIHPGRPSFGISQIEANHVVELNATASVHLP